jgi:hypothetical protein
MNNQSKRIETVSVPADLLQQVIDHFYPDEQAHWQQMREEEAPADNQKEDYDPQVCVGHIYHYLRQLDKLAFYNREFFSQSVCITRELLESEPYCYCTKEINDVQMRQIVTETERSVKECLGISQTLQLNLQNDGQAHIWKKKLGEVLQNMELPHREKTEEQNPEAREDLSHIAFLTGKIMGNMQKLYGTESFTVQQQSLIRQCRLQLQQVTETLDSIQTPQP